MSELNYTVVRESTKYYACCDHIAFEYACAYCLESMGCYYCTFNLDERHDCMAD